MSTKVISKEQRNSISQEIFKDMTTTSASKSWYGRFLAPRKLFQSYALKFPGDGHHEGAFEASSINF
jgi:hypothetical protein